MFSGEAGVKFRSRRFGKERNLNFREGERVGESMGFSVNSGFRAYLSVPVTSYGCTFREDASFLPSMVTNMIFFFFFFLF